MCKEAMFLFFKGGIKGGFRLEIKKVSGVFGRKLIG